MKTEVIPWTADLNERRDQLAEFARVELGIDCHVFFGDELGIDMHPGTGGFAAYRLNTPILEYQPALYRGKIPAIVLARTPAGVVESQVTEVFDAMFAHEIAHVAEWIFSGINYEENEVSAEELKVFTVGNALVRQLETCPVPWLQHDYQFIRVSLHTAARFAQVDVEINPAVYFNSANYELSPFSLYAAALEDEVRDRLHLPLSEAFQGHPPAGFTNTFLYDVLRWQEKRRCQLAVASV